MCNCDLSNPFSFFFNKCRPCVENFINSDCSQKDGYILAAISTEDPHIIKNFIENGLKNEYCLEYCVEYIFKNNKDRKLLELFKEFKNINKIIFKYAVAYDDLGKISDMIEKNMELTFDSYYSYPKNVETIKLLFKHKLLDIEHKEMPSGGNLLHLYTRMSNIEICKFLIEKGIILGQKDRAGAYEVHYAKNKEIRKLILEAMFKNKIKIKIE